MRGFTDNLSRKLSRKKQELLWRRNKVMDLSSKGMTQDQIAVELKVSQGTVSDDITNLKAEAQKHLEKHITENLPHEYQKCMIGINQVLNMAWSIAKKALDDKVKLQALDLINNCNKYKMDLTTNGSLVMDSVKIVQGQLNHLNGMEKKILQDIKTKRNEDSDGDIEEEDDITTMIEEEKDIIEQYQQQQQQQQNNTTNGIF